MRLTPEDAQAIDLLLDGNGRLEMQGESKERLQTATKVLRMLDALPSLDPSTNLIDLTLQRVEDAAGRAVPATNVNEGIFLPPTGLHAS